MYPNRQNNKRKETSVAEFSDLTPPQAIEMEEAVLGAILLEKTAYNAISDVLQSDMFYKVENAKVYEAITQLVKIGKPIDMLTVIHQLRSTGELQAAGGNMYVMQLANKVASSSNIQSHAFVVLQEFLKRELAKFGALTAQEAYSPIVDVFELIDKLQNFAIKLSNDYIPSGQKTIKDAIEQVGIEISERAEGNKPTGSILSTMNAVNKQLGGYNNSDMVVIGARSGMGKTSYIISEALGMALRGEPVGFFSLEMSTTQIVYRIAAQVTGIDLNTLTREQMSTDMVQKFYTYVDKIKALPIYFDDTAGVTIQKLRAKAHKMKERHGIKILFVDYMQLIKGEGGNREQEVSNTSKMMKQIAKELNIPVVVLAQLSREVEKRSDKKPLLSDLRESGSIEQDADIVGFLFRPSYYGFDQDESGNAIATDYAELIIAKFRSGQTGVVPLRYRGYLTMYSDIETTWNENVKSQIQPNNNFIKPPF